MLTATGPASSAERPTGPVTSNPGGAPGSRASMGTPTDVLPGAGETMGPLFVATPSNNMAEEKRTA